MTVYFDAQGDGSDVQPPAANSKIKEAHTRSLISLSHLVLAARQRAKRSVEGWPLRNN